MELSKAIALIVESRNGAPGSFAAVSSLDLFVQRLVQAKERSNETNETNASNKCFPEFGSCEE